MKAPKFRLTIFGFFSNGKVQMALQTKTLSNFPLDKSYNGIADITYDSLHHRIIAPIMEENKLVFFQLK